MIFRFICTRSGRACMHQGVLLAALIEPRFIPAGAGNRQMPRQPAHRWAVHPRWRGEQPLYGSNGEKTSGSSPLARGTADDEQRRLMWGRFIPAGAGNRPSRRRVSRSASVHPRWRGEQIVLLNRQIDERGSSPLARGTVMTTPAHRHRRRFIPAGAGNSVVQCRCRRCHAVHPRWRGEQYALRSE